MQTIEKPRTLWHLKSCPKCHGDVVEDQSDNSVYCLNCGLRSYHKENLSEIKNEGDPMSKAKQNSQYSQHEIIEHKPPEDEHFQPNYKDDIIVRTAMKIDERLIVTKITNWLSSNGYPITQSNVEFILSDILANLPVVSEATKGFLQRIKDIEDKKIGTILYTDNFAGKDYSAVIADNIERNIGSSDEVLAQGLDVKQNAVCPNPYCNLMGQFYFEGHDHKLDYYCPSCKITWHWENHQ